MNVYNQFSRRTQCNKEDIKKRLFILDASSVNKINQKEYIARIKNLTQAQRQLVIEILNNPNPQITKLQFHNLNAILSLDYTSTIKTQDNFKEVHFKTKSLKATFIRALKNRFSNRISSSSIIAKVSQTRLMKKAVQEKINAELESPSDKITFNEKIDLISKTPQLEVSTLKTFFRSNTNELFKLAYTRPQAWDSFIQTIKIKYLNSSEAKGVWDVLACLTFMRDDYLFDKSLCLPPDIVNMIIPHLSKNNIEGSLIALQALSGSFNLALIANFIKYHRIPLSNIPLTDDQLNIVAKSLGEKLDLSSIGILQGHVLTVTGIFSNQSARYLKLFNNSKALFIFGNSDTDLNYVKLLPKLRFLTCHTTVPISDEVLQIFGSIPTLQKLELNINPSQKESFNTSGILFLKQISNLTINGENLDFESSLGKLTQLEHLELFLESHVLVLPPNIRSLALTGSKTIDLSFLNALQSLSNLEKLQIFNIDLINPELKLKLSSCKFKLKSLYLVSCTNFSSTDSYVSNLKELYLDLYPDSTASLVTSTLPNLKILHNKNFPNKDELRHLPNLQEFHFLGRLINGAVIIDASLRILLELDQLKVISFKYEIPSDEQLNLLKQTNLKRIVFPGTKLIQVTKNNKKIWINK